MLSMDSILDRHMVAFISVRDPKSIDPYLGHIISHDRAYQVVQCGVFSSAYFRRDVHSIYSLKRDHQCRHQVVDKDRVQYNFASARHQKEQRIDAEHHRDVVDERIVRSKDQAGPNDGIRKPAGLNRILNLPFDRKQWIR